MVKAHRYDYSSWEWFESYLQQMRVGSGQIKLKSDRSSSRTLFQPSHRQDHPTSTRGQCHNGTGCPVYSPNLRCRSIRSLYRYFPYHARGRRKSSKCTKKQSELDGPHGCKCRLAGVSSYSTSHRNMPSHLRSLAVQGLFLDMVQCGPHQRGLCDTPKI